MKPPRFAIIYPPDHTGIRPSSEALYSGYLHDMSAHGVEIETFDRFVGEVRPSGHHITVPWRIVAAVYTLPTAEAENQILADGRVVHAALVVN